MQDRNRRQSAQRFVQHRRTLREGETVPLMPSLLDQLLAVRNDALRLEAPDEDEDASPVWDDDEDYEPEEPGVVTQQWVA